MASFTEHLRSRGEAGLAALLAARPDLASPAPSSVRSLAARATHRGGLERALAAVDASVLTVLEAVIVLDRPAGGPTSDDVARASGLDPAAARAAVGTALDLALLWTDPDDDTEQDGNLEQGGQQDGQGAGQQGGDRPGARLHPSPGLADVLGPHPAGLGPPLVTTLARRSPQALTRLAQDLRRTDLLEGTDAAGGTAGPPGPGADLSRTVPAVRPADLLAHRLVDHLAAHLADPAAVAGLLERAPAGARAVLDALTWGPPVGRSPSAVNNGGPAPARAAVEWLLRYGLLAVGDQQHVVLPREVSLALRDGRTHRDPPGPPEPQGAVVDPRTVAAESAQGAQEMVRLVDAVLAVWGQEPPVALRAGGLASRDLRRLAARLDVAEAAAALVVEVGGTAGLLADDGEAPATLLPTTAADEWSRLPLPDRWAWLAAAWLTGDRAAWLVGTRDERGALRAALDPELRRPWAPRLRAAVLHVLADAGDGDAPRRLAPDEVHDVLRWRTPRAVPPAHAVEAVMSEAAALGVLGGGALSPAGRALLDATVVEGGPGSRGGALRDTHGSPSAPAAASPDPAAALADQLPPAVDEVLLQGDLTGIVPGRPSPELAAVLEGAAQVESRGAGLTVRFTEASVRRALDTGRPAEDLLAALSRHARGGVPQPLEYLVLDTARRHGRVRVGTASSYLRADDATLLAGLAEDRTLRALGLVQLAPGVIAAQVPPGALLAALRERGLAPVAEGPGGQVLLDGAPPRRTAGPRGPRRPRTGRPAPSDVDGGEDRRLRRLARDLLAADRRETASLTTQGAAPGATGAVGGAGQGSGGPRSPAPDGADVEGRRQHGDPVPTDAAADSAGVVGATAGGAAGTPDPVVALALLREAAARGSEVWLEIVGPGGTPSRRKVRPLRVDGGRVRALDTEREAELTVAVHRIAGVAPA